MVFEDTFAKPPISCVLCKQNELPMRVNFKCRAPIHRRTKVHEFSYNATVAKNNHLSNGKAKIQRSASNTTYQHVPGKEY